ncbi:coiled-coil domain-containing protein [Paraburkholderia phosphatilytica]|uniref:coiled-coil domain-containing protein n=1 Tax=Paraburkholderia phosphatilytica TaxID=2282883 RepID=UPI000E4E4069|nr:acetate kinase [Paraburkholderia phosphatilytica]
MRSMPLRRASAISSAALLLFGTEAHAQSLETQAANATQADIKALRAELDQRIKELDALKRKLADEEANFDRLSREIETGKLENERGAGSPDVNGQPVGSATVSTSGGPSNATVSTGGATAAAQAVAADQVAQNNPDNGAQNGGQNSGQPNAQQPVGEAPVPDTRPPSVAPIFEQPGVLTPKGTLVVEPYFQFQYSSEDQLSLVGYTIIPALLIGLINVSEVRTTTLTGGVAFRYGLTNRLEFEVRVPYVYQTNDAVSRQVFTGTAENSVISSNGNGIGDVEMTMRYQLNQGGPDKMYYVGWLRFKTATGKSPFDVVTDCVTTCIANTTGTGLPLQQPTGSGFYAIQPGLTWLFPTDPVVFFGNFSYLHSFGANESLTLLNGVKEPLGKVQPGDVYGFNIGMGLSLNEKASVSLGYDQSIVMTTTQNGATVPGTTRLILGTLLLGYSYRLSPKTTINFSIGAGLTRDTPDLTLTLRLPMSF